MSGGTTDRTSLTCVCAGAREIIRVHVEKHTSVQKHVELKTLNLRVGARAVDDHPIIMVIVFLKMCA